MRKYIFILFLLITTHSFSQENYKQKITSQFLHYNELIKKGEYEKSMEYIHDDFFKTISKDKLVEAMKVLFTSKDIEFNFGETKINHISAPQIIDNKTYAKIDYTSDMSLRLIEDKNDTTSVEEKSFIKKFTLAALQSTFGEENVKYDPMKDFYDVHTVKKAIASFDEKQDKWKFIVIEEKQKPVLKMFLPEEILTDR